MAGGQDNRASGEASSIGGGKDNRATDRFSTVSSGERNEVDAEGATISGGSTNEATDDFSTVAGGENNRAGNGTVSGLDSIGATVSGGRNNESCATYAPVSGGQDNIANEHAATVAGGENNRAIGSTATTGGGINNIASGQAASIGGGEQNVASGSHAVVAGGDANVVNEDFASVGGGAGNTAGGRYATVPSGRDNNASGNYCFASGRRAAAVHEGVFIWADSTPADLVSQNSDEFRVRASGGTVIYSDTAAQVGVQLPPNGASWLVASDRTLKENFAPIRKQDVLEKVADLQITRWNLKAQGPEILHVGPMAQDVHAAFELGASQRHINSSDADGVALVAIQALYERSEEKGRQAQQLQEANAALQDRIDLLVERVMQLEHTQ